MWQSSSSDRVARSETSGAAAIARSALFNLALWSWTAIMLVAAIPWFAFPPRLMVAHSRAWMRGVQFLLATIVGLDYEVRGRPAGPRARQSSRSSTSPRGRRSRSTCCWTAPRSP